MSNPKATSEYLSLKSDYEEECRLRKEAERERDNLAQDNALLADEVRGLEVELKELREDKERMDHLEKMPVASSVKMRPTKISPDGKQLYRLCKTCREAIDTQRLID